MVDSLKMFGLGIVSREPYPVWRDRNYQPGRVDEFSEVMRIKVCPFFDRILLIARLAGIEDMETREQFCGSEIWTNVHYDDHRSGNKTKMACNEVFFHLLNQLEVVAEKIILPEGPLVDLNLGADVSPEKVLELKEWLNTYDRYHR